MKDKQQPSFKKPYLLTIKVSKEMKKYMGGKIKVKKYVDQVEIGKIVEVIGLLDR
jgi:hypothetical protein